jgi:WD40 repeat protein
VVSNAGSYYGESVDWNYDGTRVAFGLESPSSNNLRVYTRSGDTFTKAADVNTWPAGGVHDVAWSNTDDSYLAVAHDNSPYVSIYAGSNYNKYSNPATLPGGSAFAVAFSPDDSFLAVGFNTTPYIHLYSRSGNTFTKVTGPSTDSALDQLPNAIVHSISWSPDGNYLALGTAAGIKVYYRSGNNLYRVDPDIDLSANGTFTVDWAPSGNVIAVGWAGALVDTAYTTDFGLYRVSGNTVTWANSAATSISSNVKGVFDLEWIDGTNGTQLAVGHTNTITAGRGVNI